MPTNKWHTVFVLPLRKALYDIIEVAQFTRRLFR